MALDADWIVVGAGCAGLSFLVHAQQQGALPDRVILIDPRTTYARDRTFSFWDVLDHPFSPAVAHRYSAWRVSTDDRQITQQSPRYHYCSLPADAFYDAAWRSLRTDTRIRSMPGVTVTSLDERSDEVRVATRQGELRASLVFDSRPPPKPPAGALLQHFMGWFVTANDPVFDPTVAELMDFRLDQTAGIHFMYVLPTSSHQALVEDTFFSATAEQPTVYSENIRTFLAQRYGLDDVSPSHTEEGVIPMSATPPPTPSSKRICALGLRGGLAKPSSGYAFLAIQRHSAELARRLHRQVLPTWPKPRTSRTLFLDGIFLSHLQRFPAQAPALFLDLFRRAPVDSLVRFLSESDTLADDLAVMAALPTWPFVREALHLLRSRAGQGG